MVLETTALPLSYTNVCVEVTYSTHQVLRVVINTVAYALGFTCFSLRQALTGEVMGSRTLLQLILCYSTFKYLVLGR